MDQDLSTNTMGFTCLELGWSTMKRVRPAKRKLGWPWTSNKVLLFGSAGYSICHRANRNELLMGCFLESLSKGSFWKNHLVKVFYLTCPKYLLFGIPPFIFKDYSLFYWLTNAISLLYRRIGTTNPTLSENPLEAVFRHKPAKIENMVRKWEREVRERGGFCKSRIIGKR